MKRWSGLGVWLAFAVVVAACGDGADAGQDSPPTGDGDLTFHIITHADDSAFWSVVQRGAEDAAAAVGVNLAWWPSNNDPGKQVRDIDAAIEAGSDGVAISLPVPEVVAPAAQRLTEAGIPLYTLNLGVNHYQELGGVTHIGQTEVVAGRGAGDFFDRLGATRVLCARQEESNLGLEERCRGLEESFAGEVVSEFVGLDSTPTDQVDAMRAILQADPSIDGILGVGPVVAVGAVEAEATVGRDLFIGGFDLSVDLLSAIRAGEVDFTVDQQQYLQGYLPVVLMFLQAENANTVGGGLPILTGPGFVTADNVDLVLEGVERGTR